MCDSDHDHPKTLQTKQWHKPIATKALGLGMDDDGEFALKNKKTSKTFSIIWSKKQQNCWKQKQNYLPSSNLLGFYLCTNHLHEKIIWKNTLG
jgi:hypothetical protein